jgi:hypothetical protein
VVYSLRASRQLEEVGHAVVFPFTP